MTSPRPDRSVRRRSVVLRVAVIGALLASGIAVAAGVLADPGGHTFAANRPTVVTDPPREASSAGPTAPSTAASTAPSGRLQVLGLGDSVTAATNCGCTDFITALGRRLADAQNRPVATVNQGVSGATAADLADDLRTDDELRRTVARSDVIVVTIGANDLAADLDSFHDGGCDAACYSPDVDAMGDHLRSAVAELRQLRGSAPTTILLTTYWNVFTDGDVAEQNESRSYPVWSDQITRAANATICRIARSQGAPCVDLYTPFKGSDGSDDPTPFLAADGDHPDAAGEQLITSALFAALTDPTLGRSH